jgi:hypothetical protein
MRVLVGPPRFASLRPQFRLSCLCFAVSSSVARVVIPVRHRRYAAASPAMHFSIPCGFSPSSPTHVFRCDPVANPCDTSVFCVRHASFPLRLLLLFLLVSTCSFLVSVRLLLVSVELFSCFNNSSITACTRARVRHVSWPLSTRRRSFVILRNQLVRRFAPVKHRERRVYLSSDLCAMNPMSQD